MFFAYLSQVARTRDRKILYLDPLGENGKVTEQVQRNFRYLLCPLTFVFSHRLSNIKIETSESLSSCCRNFLFLREKFTDMSAKKNPWKAETILHALQTDSYNCGIFVLRVRRIEQLHICCFHYYLSILFIFGAVTNTSLFVLVVCFTFTHFIEEHQAQQTFLQFAFHYQLRVLESSLQIIIFF